MDKYLVEKWIGPAKDVIADKYQGQDSIDKMMRSKMSAFGAAILMSGVLPAIAFFQKNEPDVVTLVESLYGKEHPGETGELFDIVRSRIDAQGSRNEKEITEDILTISVSLKLAFNLFHLVKQDEA